MKEARAGFTIVELLIVIVVIAILAAISVVAYSGIQERARTSELMSALSQANKRMALWSVDNPSLFPVSLADIQLADSQTISYQYAFDNAQQTYCITATHSSGVSYYVSNSSASPQPGVCNGYNLVAWSKPNGTPPFHGSGTAVDTSVYRISGGSVRISPNSLIKNFKNGPFASSAGQVFSVSLWIKSDLNWDGVAGNSKIRFGNASDGGNGLLNACPYNGVKAVWTLVTCNYTVASGVTLVNVSVSNDGTTGNIWIDDVSLSIT